MLIWGSAIFLITSQGNHDSAISGNFRKKLWIVILFLVYFPLKCLSYNYNSHKKDKFELIRYIV